MANNIVIKIENLLRLAKSDNIFEAALAASKAQELAAKYNIVIEILEEKGQTNLKTEIIDYYSSYKEPLIKDLRKWELGLAQMLSEFFQCRVFILNKNNLNIVGYSSDIFLFESMFSWLRTRLICIILEEDIDEKWSEVFAFGAIHFLKEEFRKQQEKTKKDFLEKFNNAKTAINKLENRLTEIDSFLNKRKFEYNKLEIEKIESFNQGYNAAAKISLNKSLT